jgi:hypothetical protein
MNMNMKQVTKISGQQQIALVSTSLHPDLGLP